MNLKTRHDKITFLKKIASGNYTVQEDMDYTKLLNTELDRIIEICEKHNIKKIGPEHNEILCEADIQFLNDISLALEEREPEYGRKLSQNNFINKFQNNKI